MKNMDSRFIIYSYNLKPSRQQSNEEGFAFQGKDRLTSALYNLLTSNNNHLLPDIATRE